MARRRLSRIEQKDRTRTRLMQAAAKVFASKGYAATGLDEVAAHAGLTKGAVYSNFTSKADLALAVLDQQIVEPQLEIFGDIGPGEDFEDQHERGGKLLAERLDRSSLWFQVELECILHARREPGLMAQLQARDDVLRRSLATSIAERMRAAGWTASGEMAQIVDALVAVTSGIALQRLKDPDRASEEILGRLIAAVYHEFAFLDEGNDSLLQEADRGGHGDLASANGGEGE